MRSVKMHDIILLTIPKMEIRAPLVGPAALKAVAEKEGFTTKCIDLNIELYSEFREQFPNWWEFNDFTFMDDDLFDEAWNSHLKDAVIRWVSTIADYNPKIVGITVLGYWTERFCTKLIDLIDLRIPDCRIILGGPGTQPVYGQEKLEEGLIHAYFTGEGEISFAEYLRGNPFYPGINGRPAEQIGDMNSLPFPDYSDYDMSKYSHAWGNPEIKPTGATWLYITGTRGCIKRCTFCNVGSIWPKFIGKTGDTIARELKHYVETTGIKNYYFTDSLLNGNCDALLEMAESIVKFGLDIRIKGQWIARGEKVMPPSMWDTLAKAGLHEIIIGIESGSQKIRNDMKKGVSEADIDYTFDQCQRHGIRAVPLLMIGYPTETEEDFQDNLKFWERYEKYNDGTIHMPYLGTTTRVLPNTPLETRYKDEMWFDEFGHWVYRENNMKARIERWFRMRDKALEHGYKLTVDAPTVLIREYKEITGIDLNEKYGILRKGEKIWADH
jgi:radical SAM superfamily enzyme YgiQ (UPF0313 family)